MTKKLEEVYFFKLEKAFKAFKQSSNKFFEVHNIELTSDQWVVLKVLSENTTANQRQLAKAVYKDPASVTRILEILNSKKLIIKNINSGDKRNQDVKLSSKGVELVKRVIPLAEKEREKGLKGLTIKEKEIFEKGLDVMFKNFS